MEVIKASEIEGKPKVKHDEECFVVAFYDEKGSFREGSPAIGTIEMAKTFAKEKLVEMSEDEYYSGWYAVLSKQQPIIRINQD